MAIKTTIPKEYLDELKKHPYIAKATEWTVSFTPEFKRIAYNEYYNGKSMRQIFANAGFNIEKLGIKRLENFRNKLFARVESNKGFEDLRKNNSHKEPQSTEAQMAKRIRELEHRNAYLEQENEFLKKIQFPEKKCCGKAEKQK